MNWPQAKVLYLSPHPDDVVLSCGGIIAQQAQAGESIAVITLFAASPPPAQPLSPFAQSLHARWQASAPPGVDFGDPAALRREEDRQALQVLHPAIEVVHFPLSDCIYRRHPHKNTPLYDSEEAIFGPVDPADPALAALRDAPSLSSDSTLIVPLGVGGHVDHRLIRQVVAGWTLPLEQVHYYTDYPYATQTGAVEAVIGGEAGWQATTIPLSDDALAAKIKAVAEHRSQISTFWHNVEAMAAALRAYAEQVGGEVLWQRLP